MTKLAARSRSMRVPRSSILSRLASSSPYSYLSPASQRGAVTCRAEASCTFVGSSVSSFGEGRLRHAIVRARSAAKETPAILRERPYPRLCHTLIMLVPLPSA